MKSITGIKRSTAIVLTLCLLLLAGCTPGGENPSTSAPVNSGKQLSFVAADKTNWDKEVTIGDYKYTLAVNLKEGGALELVGTCTGRYEAQAGGNNTGGSGGSDAETEATEATEPPATLAPMTDSEKEAQNFTKTGTWEYEKGYGYTLTIDGYTTKTNFNKASGRHYFYADITHNGATVSLQEFQGKDSDFRKEIAADYEDFEIRDAKLSFYATGTTGNGNASATKLYLEKDGSVNSIAISGSSTTYERGTWKENADKTITMEIGGSSYSVDYCDVAGKEGYRVNYSSSTMYCTLSGAEANYTDEDFNGKTILTMQCAEQDYTLVLSEKGFAILYEGETAASTGKYVKNGDDYTVTVDGKEYVSADGKITVSFEKAGNSSGTETVSRTFNLDGSVPEGGSTGGNEGGNTGGNEGGESGGTDGGTEGGNEGGTEGGESGGDAGSAG